MRTAAEKAARKAARTAGIQARRDATARMYQSRREQARESHAAALAVTPAILALRASHARNEAERCNRCSRPGLLPEACDDAQCPRAEKQP